MTGTDTATVRGSVCESNQCANNVFQILQNDYDLILLQENVFADLPLNLTQVNAT
jgi:hypothetical protein